MNITGQEIIVFGFIVPALLLILVANARPIWSNDDKDVSYIEILFIFLFCYGISFIIWWK